MQLVIEISDGPLAGRKAWIIGGQSMRVGRSLEADLAVADDGKLSHVHFELSCSADQCQLRDLGSRNGTFVNGKNTGETQLADGDVIYAGQTTFGVQITVTAVPRGAMMRSPETASGEPAEKNMSLGDALPVAASGVESAPPSTSMPTRGGGIRRVVLREPRDVGGARLWLLPGQRITVGRTEVAEFVVAGDQLMSHEHFCIECQRDRCLIRDLGSSNGTQLNGQNIEQAELSDGDAILAGGTTFVVEMEGSASGVAAESAPEPQPPTYVRHVLNPRVTSFTGVIPAQLLDVLERLGKYRPLHVVIEPEKQAYLQSKSVANSRFLLNWLAEEILAEVSPAVLPLAEYPNLLSFMLASWDCDAIVCLYSELDKRELTERLRNLVRQANSANSPAAGVMACFWPSILTVLLTSGEESFIERLFAAVDAVLVESQSPGGWAIFASDAFGDALQRLGFREQPGESAGRGR